MIITVLRYANDHSDIAKILSDISTYAISCCFDFKNQPFPQCLSITGIRIIKLAPSAKGSQHCSESSVTWKTNFLRLRGLGILLSTLETLGSGKVKSILDSNESAEFISSFTSMTNSLGLDNLLSERRIPSGLVEGETLYIITKI